METNQTQHAEDRENPGKGSRSVQNGTGQDSSSSKPLSGDGTAPGAEEELSMADLLKAEARVSEKVHSRGVVTVRVVQVTAELVLVDIGEKKEGAIPLADFQDEKTPQPGDEVQAVLGWSEPTQSTDRKKGGEGRYTMLSHRRAREKAAWEMAGKMFEAKERVKGKVTEIVKGGYIVDLSGLRAFMPLSLSEFGGAHKHYLPPNAKVKFYITDFSEKDRKVVVSRRAVLEEDEKERRGQVLAEAVPGSIVRGVVSRVMEEGLLVRFQGIEGLVRPGDVSWRNPVEALKAYKRGQRVKCKILSVDREGEKIAFGLKQLMPNPVDILKRKFAYRSRVKAVVVSLAPEGAVVKVNGQVEGFITPENYGSEGAPKEGQEIEGVVVGINPSDFRLTLSIKSCEDLEDRRRMQQYLKGAPSLTLGQILLENSEDEGEL